VLGQVQRPLWESELDTAVANAITRLPRERRTTDRTRAPVSSREEPENTTP
jgi:capsid protein